MRRWLFNITLVISLAAIAILTAGLFVSPALVVQLNYPTAVPPICRERTFKVYRGQVEIFTEDFPPGAGVAMPVIGRRYVWDGNWRPMVPGGKALASFDAHFLPAGSLAASMGATVYLVAFPIWCLAFPFIPAPVWWFWKWRRKQREMRKDSSTAFPVGFKQ